MQRRCPHCTIASHCTKLLPGIQISILTFLWQRWRRRRQRRRWMWAWYDVSGGAGAGAGAASSGATSGGSRSTVPGESLRGRGAVRRGPGGPAELQCTAHRLAPGVCRCPGQSAASSKRYTPAVTSHTVTRTPRCAGHGHCLLVASPIAARGRST